jgi:starch phosphorylase
LAEFLPGPQLTKLISEALGGDDWLKDLSRLSGLERFVHDAAFREKWRRVKQDNKRTFASWIFEKHGLVADPDALYDVQVKRIHEYKRQHLAALYLADTFLRIKDGDTEGLVPRSFIFSGKAAPAYHMAKLTIRFINALSEAAARDAQARTWLHVVFVPDFNVKNAQHIYPAADLSEQISTAGKEASGTGNMKMSMNGALTIGTLDGANVEIRERVGADHFFLFGLTAERVEARRRDGYHPSQVLANHPRLVRVLEAVENGVFSPREPGLFGPLVRNIPTWCWRTTTATPSDLAANPRAVPAPDGRRNVTWRMGPSSRRRRGVGAPERCRGRARGPRRGRRGPAPARRGRGAPGHGRAASPPRRRACGSTR